MKPIRKAIFPVAGLGTRFLPATKVMPKEMLPIVDKPLIQYAVEEAVAAGITELIFITGRHKRAIEDHFDRSIELEYELERSKKQAQLQIIKNIIPEHVRCIYIRQGTPLGLGHAVLCAEPVVGNEPFAVLLADDLIDAPTGVTQQLIEAAHQHEGSVVALQHVALEDTHKYGIVSGTEKDSHTLSLSTIIEKPDASQAPSQNAVVGRYVLEPEVFNCLKQIQPGSGGEIQLTDAIDLLMQERAVFGYRYAGTRYDCGSKQGFFDATLAYGKKYHHF